MRSLLLCIATCVLAGGCLFGAAIDQLDNAADCNTICNRYKKCVDEQQDLVSCVEHCEDRSGNDHFLHRVNDCESCIDSNACDIATKCEPQCAGLVP